MMKSNCIKCGMIGWCLEVAWTGLGSLLRHDPKLTGVSSLTMFPIYGMASLVAPAYRHLRKYRFYIRGLIYMTGIFTVEYVTGRILQRYNCCPWNYSSAPLQINGVIRLDYAPLWFLTGLFYEKIIASSKE